MDRSQVLDRLRDHRAELAAMGVESLALFGSVARGEATVGSDTPGGLKPAIRERVLSEAISAA